MPARFVKDPDAVLDYGNNWAAWLSDVSDTIATSTWAAETGITIDSETETTTAATVWLSGGTVGDSYDVTNSIVTAAGRKDDRTITITIQER